MNAADDESDGESGWDVLVNESAHQASASDPSLSVGIFSQDSTGGGSDDDGWGALLAEEELAHTPPPRSSKSEFTPSEFSSTSLPRKRGRPPGITGSHAYRRSLKEQNAPPSKMSPAGRSMFFCQGS